ncbi:hypothetical protein ACN6MY_00375 [Peribacillus sp. B-H-3]|uniref:hypothetical protein n=1 Tax=Peribacillus sp. B-H-3 TaxID=3400420 RepID=UPI003B02BD50
MPHRKWYYIQSQYRTSSSPGWNRVHQNTGPGEEYAEIYNELSDENYTALEINIVIDTKEHFIRYIAFLNDYSDENTVRIPCIVEEE